MHVGIAGYRGAGKTTVFNCLTGSSAATGLGGGGRDVNRSVIKVPDERIDKLSDLFRPKKTTYADMAFVDMPGPTDAGAEPKDHIDAHAAAELRKHDALVAVVRAFGTETAYPPRGGKVDAGRDLADFDEELVLFDLMVLEKRLERLRKEKGGKAEQERLEALHKELEDGARPARVLGLDAQTLEAVSGFQLLSLKPVLALVNLPDDATAAEAAQIEAELAARVKDRGIEVMGLRAKLELEIGELPPEDAAGFLAELGLTESARSRFIRRCYAMLDLISFFTVGEDEVRAWTIPRGTPAVRAAGKIHSDLERGFIRAETIAYGDFIAVCGHDRALS
ncbi:MAG: redox-regulated ATPase YchF, partial [Polyangiaceae bacterium]|nr:redox-regulated ATPase YchF [Polyangiaceae bacterium]